MPINFPLKKGFSDIFQVVSDEDSVRGRLLQLMNTRPGERVFLPDFGVGLANYLFQPFDATTIRDLRARTYNQIAKYEPNLSLTSMDISIIPNGDNLGKLKLVLYVTDKTNRKKLMFVYETNIDNYDPRAEVIY